MSAICQESHRAITTRAMTAPAEGSAEGDIGANITGQPNYINPEDIHATPVVTAKRHDPYNAMTSSVTVQVVPTYHGTQAAGPSSSSKQRGFDGAAPGDTGDTIAQSTPGEIQDKQDNKPYEPHLEMVPHDKGGQHDKNGPHDKHGQEKTMPHGKGESCDDNGSHAKDQHASNNKVDDMSEQCSKYKDQGAEPSATPKPGLEPKTDQQQCDHKKEDVHYTMRHPNPDADATQKQPGDVEKYQVCCVEGPKAAEPCAPPEPGQEAQKEQQRRENMKEDKHNHMRHPNPKADATVKQPEYAEQPQDRCPEGPEAAEPCVTPELGQRPQKEQQTHKHKKDREHCPTRHVSPNADATMKQPKDAKQHQSPSPIPKQEPCKRKHKQHKQNQAAQHTAVERTTGSGAEALKRDVDKGNTEQTRMQGADGAPGPEKEKAHGKRAVECEKQHHSGVTGGKQTDAMKQGVPLEGLSARHKLKRGERAPWQRRGPEREGRASRGRMQQMEGAAMTESRSRIRRSPASSAEIPDAGAGMPVLTHSDEVGALVWLCSAGQLSQELLEFGPREKERLVAESEPAPCTHQLMASLKLGTKVFVLVRDLCQVIGPFEAVEPPQWHAEPRQLPCYPVEFYVAAPGDTTSISTAQLGDAGIHCPTAGEEDGHHALALSVEQAAAMETIFVKALSQSIRGGQHPERGSLRTELCMVPQRCVYTW